MKFNYLLEIWVKRKWSASRVIIFLKIFSIFYTIYTCRLLHYISLRKYSFIHSPCPCNQFPIKRLAEIFILKNRYRIDNIRITWRFSFQNIFLQFGHANSQKICILHERTNRRFFFFVKNDIKGCATSIFLILNFYEPCANYPRAISWIPALICGFELFGLTAEPFDFRGILDFVTLWRPEMTLPPVTFTSLSAGSDELVIHG